MIKQLQKLQEIYTSQQFQNGERIGLQEVAAIAADLLDCPLALITIIDANDEHYLYDKLNIYAGKETLQSFCLNLTSGHPLMIVNDTLKDITAIKNPYVHGRPYIRFFAAIMLETKNGRDLGCLSIADDKPKLLQQAQIQLLQLLAKWIGQVIEFEFHMQFLDNEYQQARKQATEDFNREVHEIISNAMNSVVFK